MSIRVQLPSSLRGLVGGLDEIQVEAGTVGDALLRLREKYPDLKRHLYDDQDKLRGFVNLFLNDDDIRSRQGLETPTAAGDVIMLIPSIAGGREVQERRREELSREDLRRYSRHLILPEVGPEGQEKLKNGRALLVGAGGLGSPAALYLAAAGVGRIGLIDFDVVDESNLQRQILHGVRDIGRPKTASAKDRLKALNPLAEVETFDLHLNSSNTLDIFASYDVVLDGTDNFPTRYLANDACVLLGKPYVYGSIYRFEGQASVFGLPGGPCYRCFFAEPPPPGLVPSCGEGGVLGVLPGIIGCIQAAEAIKLLLGEADNTLSGRLLLLDAWKMKFRELKLRRDPACPICGDAPSIHGLVDYETFCGLRRDKDLEPAPQITARELKELFAKEPGLQIIDIREPHELALGKLPNTRAMPYGQLVRRQDELDPAATAVVVCKIGVRSEMAVRLLKGAGYKGRIMNLKDGVNSWAKEVDPSFVIY